MCGYSNYKQVEGAEDAELGLNRHKVVKWAGVYGRETGPRYEDWAEGFQLGTPDSVVTSDKNDTPLTADAWAAEARRVNAASPLHEVILKDAQAVFAALGGEGDVLGRVEGPVTSTEPPVAATTAAA